MRHVDTRTRGRVHPLVPDAGGWVDLVVTVALSLVALASLHDTFTGGQFLVVSAVGVVVGTTLAHLARALRWPLVAAVVGGVAFFLVAGGPLTLRSLGDWAMLPGAATLRRLTDLAIFGWKDLLTTLPPVDGDGQLLVLPLVLGLLAGLVTTALTQAGVRHAWLAALLPVAAQVLLLGAVLLLGVHHPSTAVPVGVVFTVLAVAWLAARAHRFGATVRGGRGGPGRVAAAAALVALAAALAVPASALLVDEDERVVARTWVEPPFDIGAYPSPLAGFRRYVDPKGRVDPSNVHDKTLFEIEGVEPGTRVRFAALDRYDGMVWGASDPVARRGAEEAFQRVSSTIHNPVRGRRAEATVTLGEGWSGVWLPTVGALQGIDFELGDALAKQESFRYNLATSTGVVPSGLHRGDRYSFTAVQPDDTLDAEAVGWAQGEVVAREAAFVQGPAQKWTEGVDDPMARVLAAARHLRTQGRYSDGVGRTERSHVAGHNVWRLSDEFVNAPQMVGNDEQYAAVMALVANEIGVPARVVVGAVVPRGGRVTGKDVSAWVELRTADGSWRTLPTEEFMSHQPPAEQTPQTETPMTGTIVPPPNPVPPPSDAGEQTDADLKERKATRRDAEEEAAGARLPAWVVALLTYAGVPLLVLAALAGAVVGAKALRRRRRRRAASVSARFVGGWREVVDHARDLGLAVPTGRTVTRREQSAALGSDAATGLARRADSHVFGPRAPGEGAAAEFWEAVDAQRRTMSRAVGRRRRWWAMVNLTTLRPGAR